MTDIETLKKALKEFRKLEKKEHKRLAKLAEAAEEYDDYDDYDEACYSSWEFMATLGSSLATAVEEALQRCTE